jgi:hypothetical protein
MQAKPRTRAGHEERMPAAPGRNDRHPLDLRHLATASREGAQAILTEQRTRAQADKAGCDRALGALSAGDALQLRRLYQPNEERALQAPAATAREPAQAACAAEAGGADQRNE